MRTQGLRKRLLSRKWLSLLVVILLILIGLGSGTTAFSQVSDDGAVAVMIVTLRRVRWEPQVEHDGIALTVVGPGEVKHRQEFAPGEVPVFGLVDSQGKRYPDGIYTYELVANPVLDEAERAALEAARASGDKVVRPRQVQSGHFAIRDGVFVVSAAPEDGDEVRALPQDIVHADDVIIDGSLCVGNDCYSGLAFGFDTIVMMENNLRIYFDDTSTISHYPRNDWRIIINDSTDGGGRYFAVEDATEVSNILVLEAGAPDNSLYVDSHGDVGINTSTPYYELHIVDGDSPAVRLDQDGSYGWTPQKWDLCGNESNFFIRDATHASKLPFRIEPDAPTDSIFVKSNGNVGLGTGSPAYPMELETTGINAILALDRTDGATAKFAATLNKTLFGSVTNHKVQILINDTSVAEFEVDGDLSIDGFLHEGSDVNAKESFAAVDGQEVLDRLADVPITTWTFKASDDGARHMGPTAQDFYAAYGLGSDDKHISALDTSGVALAAIKELNAQNEAMKVENAALQGKVGDLEAENATLRDEVDDLEARMAVLEAKVANGAPPASQPWQSSFMLGVGLLLVGLILGLSVVLVRMARRSGGLVLFKGSG